MKWLADENFRNAIIRGILRQLPSFDIVRAQDVPQIFRQGDLAMLQWATSAGRVVLTHDVSTMIPAMREQLRLASRCAPIVLVADSLPVGLVVEEVLLMDECAAAADWAAGVLYLPLR